MPLPWSSDAVIEANEAETDHAIDGQPTLRADSESPVQLETSRLLSLPKELRLEIWQWVLTDTNNGRLVLRITRNLQEFQTCSKRFSNSLYKHPITSEIDTAFETYPSSPIGVALLRTNHLIHAEALPILYRSVTFCPFQIEGIFPLFLDTLSELAKSNIRYIRLITTTAFESKHACFYWALTCAHIAKLNSSLTLRRVEVQGLPAGDEEYNKRVIYAPLLKIKAPIVCLGGGDTEFQRVLAETAAEREAKAESRKTATEIDMAERRGLANLTQFDVDQPPKKRQKLQELTIRGRPEIPVFSPTIDESEIAHDLGEVLGLETFKDWELIYHGTRSPVPNFYKTHTANAAAAWIDTKIS